MECQPSSVCVIQDWLLVVRVPQPLPQSVIDVRQTSLVMGSSVTSVRCLAVECFQPMRRVVLVMLAG